MIKLQLGNTSTFYFDFEIRLLNSVPIDGRQLN